MAGAMDVDSEITTHDRIIEKLIEFGVPSDLLKSEPQQGLLTFYKQNPNPLLTARSLVSTILSASSSDPDSALIWIQWLMFNSNPTQTLLTLAEKSVGKRGVCGSVWGHNDLAYRCRTCESDPTCAICVPCFQYGDHTGHDYSIMYTGGGCCDCGDITAWNKEGFCRKHKGAENIEALDAELAQCIEPVFDSLLLNWKYKLDAAREVQHSTDPAEPARVEAESLTTSIVDMLLEFSSYSESLLSFISSQLHSKHFILGPLVNAEYFLEKSVVKKLHELFLKCIGDPNFKFHFCLSFINYYQGVITTIIDGRSSANVTGGGDQSLMDLYPLISTFSVQIFTVPTLMKKLVPEIDLLGIVVGCLRQVMWSSLGDDGKLQANKLGNYYELIMRIVDDIKYIVSHKEVSIYISQSRPDISTYWIEILQTLQYMDPHKRVTTLHTEDENENLASPFVLGSYLGQVNNAICQGVFLKHTPEVNEITDVTICANSDAEGGMHRDAKIGRLFSIGEDCFSSPVLGSAIQLVHKCVVSIEDWLKPEFVKSKDGNANDSSSSSFNFSLSSSPIKVGRFSRMQLINKGKNVVMRNLVNPYPSPLDNKTLICKLSDGSSVYIDPSAEFDANGESGSLLKNSVWFYVSFDVSSQETSFHIPVHRFLSLLLRRSLNFIYGENGSKLVTNISNDKDKDEFFERVFAGFGLPALGSIIMEHPLRIRVFCAQVRAGMWRKNGDAVILSTEWYRLVQWLEEGLESDLFLLQCCATLAPPESFVRTVQDRFGLTSYTSLSLTDHNEYEVVLVQEMLTFLIQLIKERRFCGLSTVDNLKREIIYKLSVGDVTHSQLVKSLPKGLSKNKNLQQVLDSVALYSNPSGMKQGKYSLKKEHWKELDLYHPRWSSRDLQSVEDRYFRFCKISPLNTQLPKWAPIFSPLSNIHKIATSRATLELVRTVLYYSVYGELASVPRASETVLVIALHLTSLALDISETELKTDSEISIPFLKHAREGFGSEHESRGKQTLFSLLYILNKTYKEENENGGNGLGKYNNISGLIESLLKKFAGLNEDFKNVVRAMVPNLVADMAGQEKGKVSGSDPDPNLDKRAKARQRQAAILAKMKAEQSKFAESMKSIGEESPEDPKLSKDPQYDKGSTSCSTSNMDIQLEEESIPVCSLCHDSYSHSPLCYLILLQKSKLLTFAEKGTPSWDEAGSSSSDKNESSGSASDPLDEPDSPFSPGSGISLEEYSIEIEASSDEESPQQIPPIIKPSQNPSPSPNPNPSSSIENSYSLDKIEQEIYDSILEDLANNNASDPEKVEKGKITKIPSVTGIYASCLKRDSPKGKSEKMPSLSIKPSSSTALFTMQSSLGLVSPKTGKDNGSGSGLTDRARKFGPVDCDGIHISSCGHAVHQECHERYLFSLKQRYIRRLGFEGGHIVDPDKGESLCPVCRRFANSILPASQNLSKTLKASSPKPFSPPPGLSSITFSLSLLQTASKTVSQDSFLKLISSITKETSDPSLYPSIKKLSTLYFPENCVQFSSEDRLSHSLLYWDALRYSTICTEIAARGHRKNCVESLNSELNSSSGFILSLLMGVARNSRNLSCTDVLLRYNGLHSLVGSICLGYSGKGTGQLISEATSEGETYPDILFWKMVADPVITRDPFSSLLWTLFSLPVPFLSSDEFFLPLVNLFYLVSIVQAMITCYSQSLCDTSYFSNYPLHEIIKPISNLDVTKAFFVSNSSDVFSTPAECVRRLTFPYLRRCFLLHKLMTSALHKPSFDNSASMWDGSGLNLTRDPVDRARFVRMELEGVRELEVSFGVPTLEKILKDEVVNGLALKWCQHFCEEFRVLNENNNLGLFHCVPAVPFRLLQLPLLYQDLLERYVKRQCTECMHVPDEPALCLFCGKLCTPSWKFCCRQSKCQNHATTCGAGIGVFLLIRKTTILLQRSVRLAFWPSPYLDAFGEEDHDMQRGKPLYLSEERYAALTYLVASHSLDRTSEVLRQTTIGLYAGD